jgi:RHS repeat-associated protein
LTLESSGRNGGWLHAFGYDLAGNPTTFKGVTQTFNSNNQNTAVVHDGEGNPATHGRNGLGWDPENRLTAYGATLTAGYTTGRLRAWKQTAAGRTYFLYDGAVPVVEMDATGGVTATNTFGAGGLLSRRSGGTSVFYTFDPQGSAAQRLDSAGAVLSSHVWDAYGTGQSTPLTADVFGYGAQWGYYTDVETGLQLLTYRYYDPGGRFFTRDPIGYRGGVNLYGYSANRPVDFVDPAGLATVSVNASSTTTVFGLTWWYGVSLVMEIGGNADVGLVVNGGYSGTLPGQTDEIAAQITGGGESWGIGTSAGIGFGAGFNNPAANPRPLQAGGPTVMPAFGSFAGVGPGGGVQAGEDHNGNRFIGGGWIGPTFGAGGYAGNDYSWTLGSFSLRPILLPMRDFIEGLFGWGPKKAKRPRR